MTSIHDKITNNLERIVRDSDEKGKNVEYGYNTRVIGEVDFYMVANDILFLFEVKSNNKKETTYLHALEQLDRAAKNSYRFVKSPFSKIQKYFVTRKGLRNKCIPDVKYVGDYNVN